MYFRKAILILFILMPGLLPAQQRGVPPMSPRELTLWEQADRALKQIPNIKSDTARAVVYGSLSRMYSDSVKDTVTSKAIFDHAVFYARMQLKMATKAFWNKGIASAYCNIAYAYPYPYAVNPSQAIYWLEKALTIANPVAIKNDVLLELAGVYSSAGICSRANDILMEILPYFKKNGLLKNIRATYFELGLCSAVKGNFNDYLHFQLLVLSTYSASDTSSSHIKQLNATATAYFLRNDMPHSLELLQKTEMLLAKTGHKKEMTNIYISLSRIYNGIGDYKRALEIDLKKLTLIQSQANINEHSSDAIGDIAADYLSLKEYARALEFAGKAIMTAKTESRTAPSYAYVTMAKSYLAKKNYGSALKAVKTYIDEFDNGIRDHKILRAGNYYYQPPVLGELYMEAPDTVLTNAGIPLAGRYQMAVDIFKKNIEASKSASSTIGLPDNYLDLSKAYEYLHEDAKALEAYKAYVAAKDTVAKQQDRNVLMQKELQFSYSKREDSLKYTQLLFSNQLENALKLSNQQKNIESLKNQKIEVSLQSEQNQRKANEEKLTVAEREQTLSQVTLELQKADLNAKRSQSFFLMGGIGVLLLLSLLIARSYLQQRRSNKAISQANLLLNERQEEIAAQRDQLSEAFTELKQTQQQLIQAEKMASLGELTSGIAHEIQNPLNFVNNFSDVNREMIDELKVELKAGNVDGALAIAHDIQQNEEKINHHGKRADNIVKGMLQHSRSNTGERQLSNINAIADEFLKLSYHGLRAKDKTFNAELVTNFDEDLPKANVVQQEIGRVLLNLFNNAFYAVNQKKKAQGNDYKPEVSVTTSVKDGYVVVAIRDSGTGIPNEIRNKIMQPFFTTKPTGEGTGLGLSLSYDIVVKGHGGKIDITSLEGVYTQFEIRLPI